MSNETGSEACCFCGLADYEGDEPTVLTAGTRSGVLKIWWCHEACFEKQSAELPPPLLVHKPDVKSSGAHEASEDPD